LFCADAADAVGVHAARRVEQGLQVEHRVEIVRDFLLAAQAEVLIMLAPTPKYAPG
jgi:hypothetical protein